MNTRLHVSNFAATMTQSDLLALFSPHGNVAEVNLPVERESGRPRGFAIVTMATPQGAQAAILALHGKEVEARRLTVTEHVTARRVLPAAGESGKAPGSVIRQNVSPWARLFGVR